MLELKPGVVKTRGFGRNADPFWFNNHTDDLKDVTSEASNPAIGINNIAIANMVISPAMKAANIIAKVNLDTVVGYLNDITIFYDKDSGSISVSTQKRTYTVKGKEGKADEEKSTRSVRLKPIAEAQVLSYIWTLLKEEDTVDTKFEE